MDEPTNGDDIAVGNISGSQGIAIGRNAHATVIGDNIPGDINVDARQLRCALEELYDALGEAQIPRDQARTAQTAAGNAIDGVKDDRVKVDVITQNVQKIGETLKQANTVVKEGSSLWQSVQKLAPLIGPMVGGARIVANWFGIPI